MACFWDSPDPVAVPMGNAIRGYDATRAAIAQMFEQNESIKLMILESSSIPIGDAVMTIGTARFDMKPKDGPSISFVEARTDVMRKIDGCWVMVLDHSTVLPPELEHDSYIPTPARTSEEAQHRLIDRSTA